MLVPCAFVIKFCLGISYWLLSTPEHSTAHTHTHTHTHTRTHTPQKGSISFHCPAKFFYKDKLGSSSQVCFLNHVLDNHHCRSTVAKKLWLDYRLCKTVPGHRTSSRWVTVKWLEYCSLFTNVLMRLVIIRRGFQLEPSDLNFLLCLVCSTSYQRGLKHGRQPSSIWIIMHWLSALARHWQGTEAIEMVKIRSLKSTEFIISCPWGKKTLGSFPLWFIIHTTARVML